jgi:hypothetical protein
MIRTLIFATACSSCLCTAAHGGTSDGRYTILGEGNTSCGSWTDQRAHGAWMNEAAWVLGYLTAVNKNDWHGGSNIAAGSDAEGIAAWMDQYCATHPLDNIVTATQHLVSELDARQRR